MSSASAVPFTRDQIFANRVVEVSLQQGETPQSSVVSSCSTSIYRAASKMRSRISLGLSIRGSAGENHSDEYSVFGQKVPLDDFQRPGAIRFVAFDEIDLDFVSTFPETPADLLFMLGRANP
jgi:hypothetical protein